MRAHVGHIGSALSIVELIVAAQTLIIDEKRGDSFILSKGHAALALFAMMYLQGKISEETLNTYCAEGTLLGVHPEHGLEGIEFSTGSLGHGLSYGCGLALAKQRKAQDAKVVVLMSDAECNEGSVWEAAMFAAQHKLSNLLLVIDNNGQQALGKTKEILDLSPLSEKWSAFGWTAHTVPGHSFLDLDQSMRSISADAPTVVVAQTIFGRGVSFMESSLRWHYMPLSDAEYQQALAEVGV